MSSNHHVQSAYPWHTQWLGILLSILVKLWIRTLRVKVIDHTGTSKHTSWPWILAFFHGTQMPLLAWKRRRKTLVMVSLSRDGELQSHIMRRAGLSVVRGSSSKRSVAALLDMVHVLTDHPQDYDAAFAVDGPKGPLHRVKAGVQTCAKRCQGVIVPMGCAARWNHILRKSWDKFMIVWPFSKTVVVLAAPLSSHASPEEIGDAITRANEEANSHL